MRNKLFFLFLVILFISAPLFGLSRLVDNVGLINESDAARIEKLLDTISLTYNFDLVILTVRDTKEEKDADDDTEPRDIEPMDYSAAFFNDNGYGLGKDRDGCLFLLVAERGVIWFSASGRGLKILTPTATKRLEKDVIKSLENWDFYNAFVDYANDWEEFLILDAKGGRYNILYRFNAVFILGAWLISLIIGFIIVGIWKKGMKTVFPKKKQAAVYITPGSLSFAVQQDQFIYSTVTKTDSDSESDFDDDTQKDSSGKNAENSEDESEDEEED
jgi:uncharacterized protein